MIVSTLLAAALAGTPGVAVQGDPVCLGVTARPGRSYPLGSVFVQDTGTAGEDIALTVQPPFRGQALRGLPVPPAWVSVSYPPLLWVIPRHSVTLSPGQGAYLAVTLTVPDGAPDGAYAANLTAGVPGAARPGTGVVSASLGATAATDLRFSVGTAAPPCAPSGPSTADIAASRRAAAAGDIVSTAPAARKPFPKAVGYAIEAVIGLIILAALRAAWRRVSR